MDLSTILGLLGVGLLLIAFVLNLLKILERDSIPYLILNIAGSGIAGYSSLLIGFMPFVILESVWGIAAFISLGRILIFHNKSSG